jgi:hypothetical protein
MWGGQVAGTPAYVLAPGNINITLLYGLIPAAQVVGAPDTIGRIVISEVEIYLDIPSADSAPGYANFGMGFYRTEYSSGSGSFTTQDPCLSTDANRDNWQHLEMGTAFLPSLPSITQRGITYQRRFNCNISLGQGEGFSFVLSNSAMSQVSFFYNYFVRYRKGWIF